MKILKALREEMRAFNLDTDEELDLEALQDIDLDALLGDGYADAGDDVQPLDFSDMSLDDYVDPDSGEFDPNADSLEPDAGVVDGDGEFATDEDFDLDTYEAEDEAVAQDFDDMSQEDADDIALDDPEAADDNQDFQGEIRTVRGANLVYKRKMDDGNFEELWIYNVGNDIKRETQIRRAILAGTDVDPGAQESKDGSQRADTTTAGNVQFLHIVGLPQ